MSALPFSSYNLKICFLLKEVHTACYVKFSGATVESPVPMKGININDASMVISPVNTRKIQKIQFIFRCGKIT